MDEPATTHQRAARLGALAMRILFVAALRVTLSVGLAPERSPPDSS